MNKTYSFNVKKTYCFSIPQRRIKQILNYLDKINLKKVTLAKSFITIANKNICNKKLPIIVNLSKSYVTYNKKFNNNVNLKNSFITIKSKNSKLNVNLANSFIMIKPKSNRLKVNLAKSFILINKKKQFVPKTIKLIDKEFNFEDGVCQKINEEECTLFSIDKNTILELGYELKKEIPNTDIEIKEFNDYLIKCKNNVKKNKIKKENKDKLNKAGGFVLSRTIIISSSLAIILTAFLIALKLIF